MYKEIEVYECEFNNEKFYIDFSDKEMPVKTKVSDKNIKVKVFPTLKTDSPYFVIYVTDMCNMNCSYCFNKMGTIHRSEKEPTYSIDALIKFFENLEVKDINIRFFGGEPTLNTEWIINCVEKLNMLNVNFHYNIFTNGMVLEESFIKFCIENNFQFFVSLAFDGEKYKGSLYGKQVEKNVKRLLTYTDNVIGSVVWSAKEGFSVVSMLEKYSEIGIKYITLILTWGEQYSVDTHENVKKELKEIADYYISQILNHDSWKIYVHPIIAYLKGMLTGAPGHIDSCACGKNMASIATNGDIFPCHCFTAHKGFESGNINDLKWDMKFSAVDVDMWEPCKECMLRYFCKGKCYAHNYLVNSDVTKADVERCLIEKEVIACCGYILKKISEKPHEYKALKKIIRMENEDNTFH